MGNPNFFNLYVDTKGVPNKKAAQLLYNVGLNAADMANAGAVGNTEVRTFHYTPIHAQSPRTGVDTAYDLTNADRLREYVQDRSLDKDPLDGVGNTN